MDALSVSLAAFLENRRRTSQNHRRYLSYVPYLAQVLSETEISSARDAGLDFRAPYLNGLMGRMDNRRIGFTIY